MCIEFKGNPLNHLSLRKSLPKSEIGGPNLDFHQCFCSKRLFYPKWHLKDNYYMLFEENHLSRFFQILLPKSKIELPNLDSNEFFCGKWLIHSEWHVKRYLFIDFKKIARVVFEVFISGLSYPTSCLSFFFKTRQNYLCTGLVLCVKFGFSIFISFGGIKR